MTDPNATATPADDDAAEQVTEAAATASQFSVTESSAESTADPTPMKAPEQNAQKQLDGAGDRADGEAPLPIEPEDIETTDGDAAEAFVKDVKDGQADEQADADVASDDDLDAAYTRRQLSAAERFGIDAEDLDALGERGVELARRLAKVHSDIGRRYSKIGRTEQQLRQEAPAPADATPPDSVAADLQSLQAQVAELSESVANNRRKRTRQDSDRFFQSLDADIYPQFAAAALEDLPQESPQYASRTELMTKADEIARGYEVVHGSQMDATEALHQALSIVAADAPAAAQRRRLAESLRKRARSRIARPTHHRTSREYANPKEATAEALSEWERTRGLRFFRE